MSLRSDRSCSKAAPILLCVTALACLCFAPISRATDWEDYPGKIDMGGWRIARNSDDPKEVVLLGPPGEHVVVGSANDPMVSYLFSPDYIFACTRGAAGEQYYVVERDWPTNSHLGDQRIVKVSGPFTHGQLVANATWNDEITDMTFNTPRPPNAPIFWKHPITYTFYALVVLGPLLLIVLVPLIALIVLFVWLRRRANARRLEA